MSNSSVYVRVNIFNILAYELDGFKAADTPARIVGELAALMPADPFDRLMASNADFTRFRERAQAMVAAAPESPR